MPTTMREKQIADLIVELMEEDDKNIRKEKGIKLFSLLISFLDNLRDLAIKANEN